MICLRYDGVAIVVMIPSFTVSSNKQVACKTQTLYKEVFFYFVLIVFEKLSLSCVNHEK
jgi:hypothetical protein